MRTGHEPGPDHFEPFGVVQSQVRPISRTWTMVRFKVREIGPQNRTEPDYGSAKLLLAQRLRCQSAWALIPNLVQALRTFMPLLGLFGRVTDFLKDGCLSRISSPYDKNAEAGTFLSDFARAFLVSVRCVCYSWLRHRIWVIWLYVYLNLWSVYALLKWVGKSAPG